MSTVDLNSILQFNNAIFSIDKLGAVTVVESVAINKLEIWPQTIKK